MQQYIQYVEQGESLKSYYNTIRDLDANCQQHVIF